MVDTNDLQKRADGIITRATNILTKPEPTWQVIAKETDPPGKVFTGYVMPLAAIGPIATLLITILMTLGLGLIIGLFGAIFGYLLSLATIWIVALIANALSPGFEGKNDFPAAFRLMAYSLTAAWVGGIFNLIPFVGWVLALLAGLYGFYILYKGASPIMGVPEDKSLVYTIVLVLIWIAVSFVMAMITGAIIGMIALMGLASAI